MRWFNRSAIVLLIAFPVFGQKAPPSGGAGGGGSPSTGTNTTAGNPTLNGNLNTNNNNNPSNDPFATQPIFLSGKVMFDDGSPVNKDVRIERVCGTMVRTEAHVDRSGRFSFQVGGNNTADSMMDASQSDLGGGNGHLGNAQSPDSLITGTNTGNSRRLSPEASLWGCELRAAYPGFRSETITLAGRKSLDDPNVGTIILHRLATVQGTTISVTTTEAPKSAQKNYEKGLLASRKGDMDEAEKRLSAATEEYPKYAIAWYALGQVQERGNHTEEASKSYLAAISADKHYVSPYEQLAFLMAQQSKWAESAQYSKQAIDLNPVEFPNAYWYNAVANYNLNHDADAIQSGKALIKLDTQHRYKELNRMMAELSVKNKDYAAAAEYLKTYLAQVPNAKDADALKQQLLKIEEAKAQIEK